MSLIFRLDLPGRKALNRAFRRYGIVHSGLPKSPECTQSHQHLRVSEDLFQNFISVVVVNSNHVHDVCSSLLLHLHYTMDWGFCQAPFLISSKISDTVLLEWLNMTQALL